MSVIKIDDGFYPALGTPLDSNGSLCKESFSKGIELMTGAGASGVLCMGSMGNMVSIRNEEYATVARHCAGVVAGKVPLMAGVMDCSVARVLDRIDALNGIPLDGVVATVPFYYKLKTGDIINFYKMLSGSSKYPVYIYDLPSVTQSAVTISVIESLKVENNIKGIKTANLAMILEMKRNNCIRDDFSVLYSGLDLFDIAMDYGIKKNLDGMFTCTPVNSKRMYENVENPDKKVVGGYLHNILKLRNIFIKENVFSAYTYAMGLLGCPGNYHPDYEEHISDNLKEDIYKCMKEIREI
jgi:4-hydroxy-tetrahydrodipicolinate synthase